MLIFIEKQKHNIAQYKKFVFYDTHQNICFSKNYFMFGTLGKTVALSKTKTFVFLLPNSKI